MTNSQKALYFIGCFALGWMTADIITYLFF